jgi:transcriptional antiterminator RfaH
MSGEWFILQYKPNSYNYAKKNLTQQGFDTFLPFYKTSLRQASKFTIQKRPLFPGYMFVKFDRERTNWNKINNTYGVSRLITFNSVLKSIPIKIIDNLIARCDLSGELLPVKKLKKGDQVKVLKGPFTNFIATIETYETDQRIWVLMDLMGRKTKVRASLNTLQTSD